MADYNDGSYNPNQAGARAPDPYKSSNGLQPGQQVPGLDWLNQSGGGISGQYYSANSPTWQSPSYGEVNAQGLVGQYSNPNNRPQTTQNTQNLYNQYMQNMPTVNSDPGFGAYYDHAKDRAAESINQTMAARGAYGSSAANDQIARSYSDLEADRAKNEANYNLQRLGEERQWQNLGGSLAGQADQGALARSKNEQDWTSMLGSLGLDASKLGISRTNAGMDAANAASGEKSRVGQEAFNNQMALGNQLSENTLRSSMQALGMDSELIDKILSGQIASGNQTAANEQQNAQSTMNLADAGLKGYDYFSHQ
jgi:hypothetical protein